jgi:hypothetical protein
LACVVMRLKTPKKIGLSLIRSLYVED